MGTCECGYEPSGSIKCREFLDYVKTSLLLKKEAAAWSMISSRYVLARS